MFLIERRDDVIVFSGRFDASQAEKAEQLLQTVDGSATLDFAGLDYISSAGIGLIVQLNVRLSKRNHGLRVTNAKPYVRNVFHYAGLDQLMDFGD
jgi:anti-anti-sigma factor